MFDAGSWHQATIAATHVWDDGLFTARLDEVADFKAGQFATLGLEVDGEEVKRAYSLASAPGEPLEVFIVAVEGGALSPRLAALKPGDKVWVRDKIAGLFTLDRVEDGGALWLVCTGTGLAPYIAMLREGSLFQRWERIVLVHGVRTASQLAYADELQALQDAERIVYIPVVSREAPTGSQLAGRITTLFHSGELEARAGCVLADKTHHVLLCGNPAMVKEMAVTLREERGMALYRPRHPGTVHMERYW